MDYNAEKERLEEKAKNCVLTISASDWATLCNMDIRSYYPQSVEGIDTKGNFYQGERVSPELSARGTLAQLCEKLGAEVVVDVRPAVLPEGTGPYHSEQRVYLIGTALIPRKRTG